MRAGRVRAQRCIKRDLGHLCHDEAIPGTGVGMGMGMRSPVEVGQGQGQGQGQGVERSFVGGSGSEEGATGTRRKRGRCGIITAFRRVRCLGFPLSCVVSVAQANPDTAVRLQTKIIAQSLINVDLLIIEEHFERLLLDYDRVFSTQGIPACLWRRTGEIYKGNKEFANLIGVDIDSLRDGQLCIYELMAEESAVNYWEKYGAVSFDPGQKAVLTSCILRARTHSANSSAAASSSLDPSFGSTGAVGGAGLGPGSSVGGATPAKSHRSLSISSVNGNGNGNGNGSGTADEAALLASSSTTNNGRPPSASDATAAAELPTGTSANEGGGSSNNNNALAGSAMISTRSGSSSSTGTSAGPHGTGTGAGAGGPQDVVGLRTPQHGPVAGAGGSGGSAVRHHGGEEVLIPCCFSFTIRRDQWNVSF
ncbi:unnamed protein product [Tilletia caries]|nr:unnamed protein product [Tilletia caries]